MHWLIPRYLLAQFPLAPRLSALVRKQAEAVVAEMTRRRPRVIEVALWINTAWWGYVFTFQADRLGQWRDYWRVARAGAPELWGQVSLIVVVIALLGWLCRSRHLLRLWLMASVAWYLYAGVWLMLSRQFQSPNLLYPFLLAGLALVAYLEIGIQGAERS